MAEKTADQAAARAGSLNNSPLASALNDLWNSSGHRQELSRRFTLLSLAGVGLVVGNVWPAIGGSILVAIFNGGPPGLCSRRRKVDPS